MLIASGKADEAIGILSAHDKVDDVEMVADTARLKGIAEVLRGDEEGLGRLQHAIRVRPWDEAGWEALAWGRKTEKVVDGLITGWRSEASKWRSEWSHNALLRGRIPVQIRLSVAAFA